VSNAPSRSQPRCPCRKCSRFRVRRRARRGGARGTFSCDAHASAHVHARARARTRTRARVQGVRTTGLGARQDRRAVARLPCARRVRTPPLLLRARMLMLGAGACAWQAAEHARLDAGVARAPRGPGGHCQRGVAVRRRHVKLRRAKARLSAQHRTQGVRAAALRGAECDATPRGAPACRRRGAGDSDSDSEERLRQAEAAAPTLLFYVRRPFSLWGGVPCP
jgi:hypothetical protein